MARQIRRFGPLFLTVGALTVLALFLVPTPKDATAATFVDPWWTNNSPSPECAACGGCGCPNPSEWVGFSPSGGVGGLDVNVSNRTGESAIGVSLMSFPGLVEDFDASLLMRSYITGGTQVGGDAILSFEHTVEENIINRRHPGAAGGTEVYWRQPSGRIVIYESDGLGGFTTADCSVTEELTHNSPYKITDKQGNEMLFDANGMPDVYTDRNGNQLSFAYNGLFQISALIDTRGKSWNFTHNGDGYLSAIQDPGGTSVALNYDANGFLSSIDYPITIDQPGGSSVSFTRDGSNRVTNIEDNRGNTVFEIAYVSSTPQVDSVTIDGEGETFSYSAGQTNRTDRNGNIHRTFYTGANITSTDMYVASQSKYLTTYTYSGNQVVTIVYPRGNRVDFTRDGVENLTERRHRTTDTATNDASDLVHTWTYSSNFMATHTDPVGDQTTYTRDSAGNVTNIAYPTVTNPSSQSADKYIEYNAYGQVTEVTDEEGKEIAYSYYASGTSVGLLETIEVDPTGLDLETSFEYDASGNISSTTDARGNATTFLWDSRRRLKQRTAPSPLSYATDYEYDANGNLTEVNVANIDKDGNPVTANPYITTTFTYTDLNDVLTIVEETGASSTRTTTLAYDEKGNRIRVTKPEDNKVKWDFDERDFVSAITRGETSGDASTREFARDDNGNLVTVTDGEDNDTTHTYDLFDRRTKTTDPMGHYTTWALDKNGRTTQISRKNVGDTELQQRNLYYDERGRLWKTSDVHKDPGSTYSNADTVFERFMTGHLKTITDARSKDTDYDYDDAWRRTSATDEMGNVTTWTLDANGNPTAWDIEEVDGGGSVTHEYEATYDVLNRRLTYGETDRIDIGNELETTYGYDSRSNLVWKVNAKGDPTRWTFDAAGRMTKKEVAIATGTTIEDFTTAIVREWDFDYNDRLTSHKDDAGNESLWTYDALGRVTGLKYPDLEKITYVYDDADNVTKTTDAAGNVIDDVYDNNRRTSRTVTRATGFLGTTSETFTYDGLGRMTKAEDNDYKVELTYGVIGLSSQVYEEKQSYVGGTAYLKTVKKTYDAVGNKITELYPSNLDLDYTWNDISRLSTATDGTNTIASYAYIGVRRKTVTFQNGATASYSYTGFRGEVSRIHHETSSPATIIDLQYGYDDTHDRTYERYGASGQPGDAFEYDKARRLTVAWMGSADVTAPSSSAYTKKIEYTMDDDGNRCSVAVTPYGESTATTSYTDNNLNQYTAVGGTSRTHDDNGNLTDDGTLDFEYDYRNQIVRVKEDTTTIAEYKYDALGRRVEKYVDGDTERFVYSGHETVSVYDGSDTWIRDFVFGAVIDEVLMLKQADVLDFDSDSNTTETTRSFYHRNALGSVMEITDMNEAVPVSYRYDPYGAVTITAGGTPQSSDPLGNPWMYTARFTDEETGLYYYRARYYSSVTGRFVQRDPLGLDAGPHLYTYANSNPIYYFDPLGLDEPGCDLPAFIKVPAEMNICILRCCAEHDKCYDDNDCTKESWGLNYLSQLVPILLLHPCVKCNNEVVACLAKCNCDSSWSGPPNPPYYDDNTGTYSETMDEVLRKRAGDEPGSPWSPPLPPTTGAPVPGGGYHPDDVEFPKLPPVVLS